MTIEKPGEELDQHGQEKDERSGGNTADPRAYLSLLSPTL